MFGVSVAAVHASALVVADGDGAIVVPQDVIEDVLKYAIQESENDRNDRRELFDALGIPHDESVQSMFPDAPPHPRKKAPGWLEKRLGRA